MSVLSLQPASAAALDVAIYADYPTTNCDGDLEDWLGDDGAGTDSGRVLLKFDGLSALNDTDIISSTGLDLWINSFSGFASATIEVYRQSRAWVENQATWNIYSTGNAWQTAGAKGANDTDATLIGSLLVSTTGHHSIPLTGAFKPLLDLGNGWLLKVANAGGYVAIAMSEDSNADHRPKLTVTYTRPSYSFLGGDLSDPARYSPAGTPGASDVVYVAEGNWPTTGTCSAGTFYILGASSGAMTGGTFTGDGTLDAYNSGWDLHISGGTFDGDLTLVNNMAGVGVKIGGEVVLNGRLRFQNGATGVNGNWLSASAGGLLVPMGMNGGCNG